MRAHVESAGRTLLQLSAVVGVGLRPLASAQTGTPEPVGPAVRVDTLAGSCQGVDVAWRCLEDLTMVVWGSDASVGDDHDGLSIQAQFFVHGQARGPQRQVNIDTAGDQLSPDVEVDYGGNFVAGWYSDDGTLRRRTFDRATLVPGPEVATPWPAPYQSGIGSDPQGSICVETGRAASVSWIDGDYLRGQRYDAAGAPIGNPLEVMWNVAPGVDIFEINALRVARAAVAFSSPSSPFAVAWYANDEVWVRWFRSYPDVLEDDFETGDVARWCETNA